MKVKTLACLCALAAVPAFGTVAVESGNTFGVLKVTCSAQKVIIATPWVKCGDATASVSVSNLVMTSGLAQGDSVLLYQGGTFRGWSINASGNWQAMDVIDGDTTYNSGENAAIARGEAFWFVKASYPKPYTPYPLYLYGQDATNTVYSTIADGSSSTPAYSLVASPTISSTGTNDVNAATFNFTPNAADEIRVPRQDLPDLIYTYQGGQWGTLVSVKIGTTNRYKKQWQAGCMIPAGTGFWYVSQGAAGTIKW